MSAGLSELFKPKKGVVSQLSQEEEHSINDLLSRIQVIVADPSPLLRDGLIMALNQHPNITVAATATNSNATLQSVQTTHPDILILGLEIPGECTIKLVCQLMALDQAPRILVISTDGRMACAMLRSGVRGYLLKSDPSILFGAAVITIAAGGSCLSKSVAAELTPPQLLPTNARNGLN